ncbi:hypothetical protein FACS1894137_02910 [Spirochaetia bacterium]|nr:hypothetical protein FACS1894137_02910 [Spirochaetia bacterium]
MIRVLKYIQRKIYRKIKWIFELKDISLKIQRINMFVKMLIEMDSGVHFQGQIDQDLLAYLYFKGKRTGFYIDIGANDGISINNTYVFEQLGWTGVCIEPLPDTFEQLKKNRKCDCYNVAIADQSGNKIDFLKACGMETWSGLKSQMSDVHKKHIINSRKKIEVIKVKTLTFNDLMDNYEGITFIDFMSIDVEGAEMSILETIDFNKYRFGLLIIENAEDHPGDGEKMKKFMLDKGYTVFFELEFDIVFTPVKNELFI